MMNRFFISCFGLVLSATVLVGSAVAEEEKRPRGGAEDGLIHVPAFDLPMSPYISWEARKHVAAHFVTWSSTCPWLHDDMDLESTMALRKCADDKMIKPAIARMRARYSVTVEQRSLGGVNTYTATPVEGIAPENENKVLIFLPGSAYRFNTEHGAQLTSLPIASVGKIKVVGVNYRTWPIASHPAANDDLVAVYREILKSYKPEDIGVYGCSAGAMLTSQITPWFRKLGLPLPAAIAMDGWAGSGDVAGDAFHMVHPLNGKPYSVPAGDRHLELNPYFRGVNTDDPMIMPVLSAEVLADFPPSLLTSATRDYGLSSVVHTHSQLVKQGVEADLHVWEGLTHCFMSNPDLPESRDAYSILWEFFEKHLGK